MGLDIPPVGSETVCCRAEDGAGGGAWTCWGNMSPPYIAHAETTPIMPAKPGVLVNRGHSSIRCWNRCRWKWNHKNTYPRKRSWIEEHGQAAWAWWAIFTAFGQIKASSFSLRWIRILLRSRRLHTRYKLANVR